MMHAGLFVGKKTEKNRSGDFGSAPVNPTILKNGQTRPHGIEYVNDTVSEDSHTAGSWTLPPWGTRIAVKAS